jgi:hypothetical protein
MIFMQQKHFNNNPRIYNNHRSRNTSNQNRTRSNPTTRSINNNEQLILNINNNNNTISNENESVRFRLYKRLTTIGGFFGTLSLISTGAFLYAIITAKSQEKWYYYSAVLIYTGLLILLIIGAFLLDRYFLKKFPQALESNSTINTSNLNHRLIGNSANRIINVNSVLYPTSLQSTLLATESENSFDYLNNSNNNNNINRSRNDIPPQYLDITNNFIFKKKNSINRSRSSPTGASSNSDTIINNNNQIKLDSSASFIQPPNYFDLYPNKETTTTILHS